MKVALCCIGRMENRYVTEYIEYYKNIGVDNVFIYDNNYDGEEYFEDVINDYIDDGFVEIVDYRNKSHCQLSAYQDCYDKHSTEYDWILFIDCGDEYLYMNGFDNVKDFLNQDKFKKYDIIHINLMNYGDNDVVNYDKRKLCERFTEPIKPLDFKKAYSFPENDHISSIVRGKLEKVEWKQTPHTPSNKLKCCDASGKEQESTSPFIHPFDFSCAHFKHYTTKTIQEWCEIKAKRGYPDGNKDYFKKNDVFKEFFKWNSVTNEKMEFIKEWKDKNKINIMIVNFNTQKLTDACIKSINKHVKNTQIFIFDNSNKEPFVNSFDNVTVLDNTKGQIIDFDKWLLNYQNKNPMDNNYGSAKHCYTIQKFMDTFDDNFILMDSDTLVKKDISELYNDKYIFIGEKAEQLAFWKPRVLPYICYINNKMCKKKNIKYFDEKRCTQINNSAISYDTGCSFLEDASKFEHKFIKFNEYIEHYAAGSWNSSLKNNSDKWLDEFSYLWRDNVNNTNIFICAHKDFKPIVNNPIYKVIDSRKIDNNELTLKDDFYSELFQYFYISKNANLKTYVGFCHYRRYFSFMDDIPNMDELFKKYDAIVAKPLMYKASVKQQYASCHNIEDLYIVGGILAEKYPEYCKAWHNFLKNKLFFPYNMFIMKSEDFKEYITFIYDVLNEYVKIVGTDIVKRIGNNVEKYLKKQYPNNTIDYQYRIGGYLAERLTNLFIITHFKELQAYPVKITEDKYKKS